ncbi:MAG: hypothetical protein WDN23_19570 [Edaphobacter sp.]
MVEGECDGNDQRDGRRELKVDVERVFGGAGLGLCGCLPFEETFARDVAADERTRDGVEREQHVVRKKSEVEDGESEGGGEGGDALAGSDEAEFEECAAEVEGQLDEAGKEKKDEARDGPVEGSAGKDEPAEEEEEKGDGLDERAAEVVEDLPLGDGVDGIGDVMA